MDAASVEESVVGEHRVKGRVVVIALGSADLGDDAVGPLIGAQLQRSISRAQVYFPRDALSMLDAFEGASIAYVVDACTSGAPAGMVFCLDSANENKIEVLPKAVDALSSHGLGLQDALDLARNMGRLPERVIVYAIEGERFAPGSALSPQVKKSVDIVVGRIVESLQSLEHKHA